MSQLVVLRTLIKIVLLFNKPYVVLFKNTIFYHMSLFSSHSTWYQSLLQYLLGHKLSSLHYWTTHRLYPRFMCPILGLRQSIKESCVEQNIKTSLLLFLL